MTKVFSPPYRIDAFPRFHPDDDKVSKSLFRHYRSAPQGVSVWVTSEGVVTTTNPNDDSAIWYRGGYLYLINDADADVLVAAGYVVSDPPPGVVDNVGVVAPPRPGYPVTWNDLASFTWDEAAQFLWGSFQNHV